MAESEAPPETPAVVTAPESPPAPEASPPRDVPTLVANVHISLWVEPGPLYLCLLCPTQDLTYAAIESHVQTVHSVTPVPSPLAADYLARNPPPSLDEAPEEAPDGGESDDGEPAPQ